MQLDLRECIRTRFSCIGPEQFEKFVAALFEKRGYRVDLTPATGDYGADLILTLDVAKVAVQVKRYAADNLVGVKDVHHLLGAKSHYKCDSAVFVTTSSFSEPAQRAAQANGVQLWDWQGLLSQINSTWAEQTAAVESAEDSGVYDDARLESQDFLRLADAAAIASAVMSERPSEIKRKIHLACIKGGIAGARPHGRSDYDIPRATFSAWLKWQEPPPVTETVPRPSPAIPSVNVVVVLQVVGAVLLI